MKRIAVLFCLLCIFLSNTALAIGWPNSAKSAVSISADDGWPSQITQASILDSRGFKGTFYLTSLFNSVSNNVSQWRSVFARGHEIGNHSASHWDNATLATKTWQAVAADVGGMEWWLMSNIYSMVPTEHTYAYPQGNFMIGSQATTQSATVGSCEYAGLLSAVVNGARAAGNGENFPNDVSKRRFFVSGLPIYGINAFNDAKAAIDRGITNGTWTVLVFHSLGDSGDGYSVTPAVYTQIIDYIYGRRTDLWVAPVVQAQNYVRSNTPTADWVCPR
jgi:peptidoglycan/xylan/chitin deacetylase (PgdA/CDA1 family)